MDIYAPSAVLNEQNIIRESISMPNSPQNKTLERR